MSDSILFDRVSKSYGKLVALNDFSFTLKRGSVLGLLGPNGAGKSTCSRLILGLENPDSGSISLHGQGVELTSSRQRLSVVMQKTEFLPRIRVGEVLDLARVHYRNPKSYECAR